MFAALAALSSSDESLIFVLLAVIAFGVAIYLAFLANYVGAVICAFIAVVILLVGVT